jgi:hypothetical protein
VNDNDAEIADAQLKEHAARLALFDLIVDCTGAVMAQAKAIAEIGVIVSNLEKTKSKQLHDTLSKMTDASSTLVSAVEKYLNEYKETLKLKDGPQQ